MKTLKTFFITTLVFLYFTSMAQNYTEAQKLCAGDRDEGNWFGYSVSISGNFALAGSMYDDKDASGENPLVHAGSAYIFERDSYGNWNEAQKLVASDRDSADMFGETVSIYENYAAIGATCDDEDSLGNNTIKDAGSVYIFERAGNGEWNDVQKVVAPDREGIEANFGSSVNIYGNFLFVGAINEVKDASGNNPVNGSGAVYIFERNEIGRWIKVQKITASDRSENSRFGFSISAFRNYIVIGSMSDTDPLGENSINGAGAAYIFKQNDYGIWNEVQKIVASDREEEAYFGYSVSIYDKYLIAGAIMEDKNIGGTEPVESAGAAYIFERDQNGIWEQVKKIVASDREEWIQFGNTVSMWEETAMVSTNASSPSVYVYTRDDNETWNETQKIVHPDIQSDDFIPVNLSGDYAIIGASYENENASGEDSLYHAGAALIFESCTPSAEPDHDNILENGDFETCVLSPWSVWIADYLGVTGNAVLNNGECTVTGITPAASPLITQVQLNQALTTDQIDRLEKGSTYILTYDAYSEEYLRPCRLSFEQSVDPWTNILAVNMLLDTLPLSYSYEFEMDTLFPDMQVSFQAGTTSGSVTIDHVRLIKKGSSNTNEESFDHIRIFPNPVRDILQIQAPDGSAVRIYNDLGILIREATLTDNQGQLCIHGLANGIYFVRVEDRHGSVIKKIVVF